MQFSQRVKYVVFTTMLIAYALGPYIFRALDVEKRARNLTDRKYLAVIETLKSDAILISLVLASLVLAASVRNKTVVFGLFSLVIVIQSFVIADAILFTEFSQRLNVFDVQKYGQYALQYLLDFRLKELIWIGGAAAILFAAKRFVFKILSLNTVSFSIAFPLFLLAFLPYMFQLSTSNNTGFIHPRFFRNFVDLNRMAVTEYRQYSKAYSENLKNPFTENCSKTEKISGPVILYMVESLSTYHSEYFGGHNNWTPEFDEIARQHLSFRNFFANGFTTEDGELSLLTAEYPLFAPSRFSNSKELYFPGYWNVPDSVPRVMAKNGYATHFLTTSDLKFSSTGDWAKSIGFDLVEGSEAEFYEGLPRFHFDAAPDEALVDRIDSLSATTKGNYFLFVKTASSHHPHIDPVSRKRSEKLVMRYVDSQIARLYKTLIQNGFFETGHLIIVGDHRAMTPLASEEIETWGYQEAFARVPAVIVSDTFLSDFSKPDQKYSQTQLGQALKGEFSGLRCDSRIKQYMANSNSNEPNYLIHRRGDIRNALSIFSDAGNGTIILDGDQTRFQEDSLPPSDRQKIIDYVNLRRIEIGKKNTTGISELTE